MTRLEREYDRPQRHWCVVPVTRDSCRLLALLFIGFMLGGFGLFLLAMVGSAKRQTVDLLR